MKEQLRAASYRRTLMSQLIDDGKIKGTADRVLGEDSGNNGGGRRLPGPAAPAGGGGAAYDDESGDHPVDFPRITRGRLRRAGGAATLDRARRREPSARPGFWE